MHSQGLYELLSRSREIERRNILTLFLLALALSFLKDSVKAVSLLHGYTFLARDPLWEVPQAYSD